MKKKNNTSNVSLLPFEAIKSIAYGSLKFAYLSSYVLLYVTKKRIITSFRLHKNYINIKPENIKKVHMSPNLHRKFIDIDRPKLASIPYYEKAILNFVDVIIDNFPSSYLTNFYNNINDIDVQSSKDKLFPKLQSWNGRYSAFRNAIELNKYAITSIYHELFHMASTKIVGNTCYTGFKIIDKKRKFQMGTALNEGYTQLLTERYFGNNETQYFLRNNYGSKVVKQITGHSYHFQVHITSKLEKIVGKEKMEMLYLEANLYGLIKELSKYASEEEIGTFIANMDFLHRNIDSSRLFPYENILIIEAVKSIDEFLGMCYTRKIKLDIDNGLDKKEGLNDLKNYLISLRPKDKRYDRYYASWYEKRNQQIIKEIDNINIRKRK